MGLYLSEVSYIIKNAFLSSLDKKNLRQLTKSQFKDLETLKLDVFTNLVEMEDVTNDKVIAILKQNKKTPKAFADYINESNINMDNSTIDDYHRMIIGRYIQQKLLNQAS